MLLDCGMLALYRDNLRPDELEKLETSVRE